MLQLIRCKNVAKNELLTLIYNQRYHPIEGSNMFITGTLQLNNFDKYQFYGKMCTLNELVKNF